MNSWVSSRRRTTSTNPASVDGRPAGAVGDDDGPRPSHCFRLPNRSGLVTIAAASRRGPRRAPSLTHAARKGYVRYLLPGGAGFLAVIFVPFGMNVAISFTSWS